MKKNSNDNIISPLKDFEILNDIIKKKIDIKDVDIKVKKRLILMCNQRLMEVNKLIEEEELKIEKLNKLLGKKVN